MDEQSIASLINYGGFAVLVVLTFFIGSAIERRHFRRIIKREKELRDITVFAIRRAPTDLVLSQPKLVCGNAVISVDYFKTFAAGLRGIIGGRIGSYESLFERARREAMLRMKIEARRHGGNIVLNVKFETTRIYSGGGRAAISVESLAYGTAYSRSDDGAQIH